MRMKKKRVYIMALISATAILLTGCLKNYPEIDEPYSESISTEEPSLSGDWIPPNPVGENEKSEIIANEEVVNPGPMNDMVGTDLDGNTCTLGDIFAQNDLTMINVWGTFCGPCIAEIPDLEQLYEDYSSENFGIVGLTCDLYDFEGNVLPSSLSDAKAIVKENKVTYPILGETAEMENYLYSEYVPVTFFVDGNGNFVGESFVGSRSYYEWKGIVDEYLKKAFAESEELIAVAKKRKWGDTE